MTTTLPLNYKSQIATYFRNKVRELRYHLETIVEISDENLATFVAGRQTNEVRHGALIYGFSAFTNTIQSIKDAGSVFLSESFTWPDLAKCRHGAFMKGARNAITHDGHPVINAWSDGQFFVGLNIVRFDNQKKQVVTIQRPNEDVRTLCLEFSLDFAQLLQDVLKSATPDASLGAPALAMHDIDSALQSGVIPQFAKDLISQNYNDLSKTLAETKFDYIGNASEEIGSLSDYCATKLGLI